MRVFVTGASGYIGSAVALAFRRSGHQVMGLVRSEKSARKLRAGEITPVIGDISDLKSYFSAAPSADVFVHCAFAYKETAARDLEAIENIFKIASHTDLSRIFIYTSGCWVHGDTGKKISDETSPLHPLNISKWRRPHEEKVLREKPPHVKTVVLRPACVYGGSGGLTALWFEAAQKGAIPTIDNGSNHWVMVHVEDLAAAYVAAAEKEQDGLILDITDGSHLTVREMVESVAAAAGIPGKISSISRELAQEYFGELAEGLAVDQWLDSKRAERLLNWRPKHLNFCADAALYLAAWRAAQTRAE
jgi:nucleoside-diphosphate-sugar epimerase